MRTRLTRWGFRLLAVALSLALTLALLELALWQAPQLFTPRLLNYAFSKYGTFPGGIYLLEPITRSQFLRPSFETRTYWNGYFWAHRTDRHGFRNPDDWEEKEVLLLGDSLIYGHGVEEEQTAAHFLRRQHGWKVYNMGTPGGNLYHYYLLGRLYFATFRPDHAIVFTFRNDYRDVTLQRSEQELEETPEVTRYDYGQIRRNLGTLHRRQFSLVEALAYKIPSLRLLRGMLGELRHLELIPRAHAGEAARSHPPDLALDEERFATVVDYYRHILPDLKRRGQALGVELILIDLDLGPLPPRARQATEQAQGMVRALAAQEAIAFFDTGELFRGCQECFLPRDGHFSEIGHRRLAAFVSRILSELAPR